MTLTILTPKEFETFASTTKERHFEQSIAFGDFLLKQGYQVYHLGLKKNSEIQVATIAWAQAMTGGSLLTIHYGPIYNNIEHLSDFLIGLKTFAKNNNVLKIEINPYDSFQTFDQQGQAISEENNQLISIYQQADFKFPGLTTGFETCDWHFLKDLSKFHTEEELLKSFNSNSRRQIKKADELGIVIRPARYEELDSVAQLLVETGERQGFKVKNLTYLQNLYKSFGEDVEFLVAEINIANSLQTITSKLNQEPPLKANIINKLNKQAELLKEAQKQLDNPNDSIIVSFAVVIYQSQEAVYLLGGSSANFHKLSTPFNIQYHAMKNTMARKIVSYNFLGISGLFDGSDGVLRFKQNFNGYIERRPGAFYYYPNPLKYKFIQAIKKILKR